VAACWAGTKPSRGFIGIKKGPTASSKAIRIVMTPRIIAKILKKRLFIGKFPVSFSNLLA
jgi:hypothetical protein